MEQEKERYVIISDDEVTQYKKEPASDLCADISSDLIPERLDEIELQIDRLKQRWGECTYLIGQRLQIIRDRKLYVQKKYNDFKTYVQVALKMSENNAYYYIAVFEYFTEEQTKRAGSKLKLIIPILNRIKKDKEIADDIKPAKLRDLRNELYFKIYNKSYRDAEKIIKQIKAARIESPRALQEEGSRRIVVKKGSITIHESDKDIQKELVKLIEDFYRLD